MLVLAFDTTSTSLKIALLKESLVLDKTEITNQNQHSEFLIFEIEKILKKFNYWYQDLSLFVTNKGPGSFTGTRVGVTAAKMIKISTSIPIIFLNSLEIIAFHYRQINKNLSVIMEFNLDEFFYGEFLSKNTKAIQEPSLLNIEEILSFLDKKNDFLFCGSLENFISSAKKKGYDLSKYYDKFLHQNNDILKIENLALLGLEKLKSSDESEQQHHNPLYIKQASIKQKQ